MYSFFLIGIVEGGVQLGPLCTPATNRRVVPASGDYDNGEIARMTGRKTEVHGENLPPVPLCPPQTPYALPGREPGPPRWDASD
jgi:hypothetical protein